MESLVGISIVNYKTAPLVEECLHSLSQGGRTPLNTRVVIVDNDSRDGSVETLQKYVLENQLSDWIEVIAAEKNGGFSYGNNIAFRRLIELECKYLWLVNPDTQPLPGACEALIEVLRTDEKAGAVGSRLEDPDGTVQIAAFTFPTPLGELVNTSRLGFLQRVLAQYVIAQPIEDKTQYVDWVAGASLMLSAELLKKIGFMDEAYFLYFEEVDYCLAIHRCGYEVVYEPSSRVIHHVGAATGISDSRKKAPRRPAYWFESRQRFFQKNYGFGQTLLADTLWILAYSSYLVRNIIQRKPDLDPPYFLRDFIKHSAFSRGRLAE